MRTHTAALYALAAILLTGCSSSPNPPAAHATPSPAARGVEAPIDTIPWSQVGPGWVLATWSPLTGNRHGNTPPDEPDPDTVSTTLYLVDPQGGRYPVTTFPPTKGSGPPKLIDWSGDKTRALMSPLGMTKPLIEVDLRTGEQTPITLSDPSADAQYTLPDGDALLLTNGGYHEQASMVRTDLTGREQSSYPIAQDFDGVLSSPDGNELVLGTGSGLALMSNDGTPGNALPVDGQTDCRPLRWWDADATTVLANCGSHPSQLWLVPVDGTAPTALTAPNDGQTGADLGDVDAWQLPAGTFVQDISACGVIYLAKLNADGTTTEVDVPDVRGGSINVIGLNGDSLRLQAKAACGGGRSLVDYNPSTNTSTVLLGPPVNGGGVISAMAFKGQR
jgi:hypothetical protein